MRFVGIDPSTKTGYVELDSAGKLMFQSEIVLENGILSSDSEVSAYGRAIVKMIGNQDLVCIEGFSLASKGQGVSTQFAIGHAIRFALLDAGIKYIEVAPTQLKKFATGKGNASKDNMILPIYKRWGFDHDSDNVRDAFVLAQIALTIKGDIAVQVTKPQSEVIQALRNPVSKTKKAKVK